MGSMTIREQGVLFADLELGVPPNPAGRNGASSGLSDQQLRFIDEYLADMNGTAAVRRAGYSCKTLNSAGVTASRLLSDIKVIAELRRRLGEITRASQITVEGVLEQLRKLAYADIRTLYNPDGTLKPVHEWPSDISARVAGVETHELYSGSGNTRVQIGICKKVKLQNPTDALKVICQYLGMLAGELEGDGPVVPGNYREVSDTDLLDEALRIADEAGHLAES